MGASLDYEGASNTAIGSKALYFNTIGYANTATGSSALILNTTGNSNTATGTHALISNTTGNSNTANGYHALFYNITGHENTGIGMYSGDLANDANSSCTYLGYDTNPSTAATIFVNSAAIGNLARFTASNQVRIGNTAVTSIGGYAAWTNISDGRFKRNVTENVPGLSFCDETAARHLQLGYQRYIRPVE
ncbi:MAG: hypothetical protein IPM82_26800 [Saprospiraceae bacterium]|nr:hypothetical protein [Saprospiraceae bacterium]